MLVAGGYSYLLAVIAIVAWVVGLVRIPMAWHGTLNDLRASRRRGIRSSLAIVMVPAILVATTAWMFLDANHDVRDRMRWELSRGAFRSTAEHLVADGRDGRSSHGAQLVGIVWVDSITVDGEDVYFSLPRDLSPTIIVRDGDGDQQWSWEELRQIQTLDRDWFLAAEH